jgi:hypothetical protein
MADSPPAAAVPGDGGLLLLLLLLSLLRPLPAAPLVEALSGGGCFQWLPCQAAASAFVASLKPSMNTLPSSTCLVPKGLRSSIMAEVMGWLLRCS